MKDELFVLGLALTLFWMLRWAFRTLPKERWQILAALPREKQADGNWTGENITYYGLFNAHAYTLALALFMLLAGAAGHGLIPVLALGAALLIVCMPASSLVARWVEKKRYTFTVGGASFVGILASPLLVMLVNETVGRWTGERVELLVFLAALSTAYCFGEGIGRLACISFGCCYGKPMDACHPFLQKLFRRHHFVFIGKTRKIAYAHGLEGCPVLPVQAVTATLYCGVGLVGVYLFLKGFFATAFLLTLMVSQLWRWVSECFRADFRGGRKISAYQWMSLASVLYAVALVILSAPTGIHAADFRLGFMLLWHPAALLCLQALWLTTLVFTGKSKVTHAFMAFHVREDRI